MKHLVSVHDEVFCRISIETSPEEFSLSKTAASHSRETSTPDDATSTTPADFDNIFTELISTALEQAGQHPVSRAVLTSGPDPIPGGGCRFTAETEVLPEIDFPQDFSAIELKVHEPSLSQARLYKNIERILRPRITLEQVAEKRLPQDGDLAEIVLNAEYGGLPVPGFSDRRITMAIDELSLREDLKEVERLVRRLHVGEQGTCVIPCPSDYPDVLVRGKTLTAAVTLQKLLRRNFPVLTDETACSLGYKDVSELKGRACMMTMNESVLEQKKIAREELLNRLLSQVTIAVPPSLRHFFLRQEMENVRRFLEETRPKEKYQKAVWQAAPKALLPAAQKTAARHTYLLAYAYSHGIHASSADIDRQVEHMAHEAGMSVEEFRTSIKNSDLLDTLEECIMAEKAMESIYSKVRKIVIDNNGKSIQPNTV